MSEESILTIWIMVKIIFWNSRKLNFCKRIFFNMTVHKLKSHFQNIWKINVWTAIFKIWCVHKYQYKCSKFVETKFMKSRLSTYDSRMNTNVISLKYVKANFQRHRCSELDSCINTNSMFSQYAQTQMLKNRSWQYESW